MWTLMLEQQAFDAKEWLGVVVQPNAALLCVHLPYIASDHT